MNKYPLLTMLLIVTFWIVGCASPYSAIQNGDKQALEEFINEKGDVEWSANGNNSLLIIAASENKPEIVRYLLQRGAMVDYSNKDGQTALIVAIHKGNTEIAKLLIEKGANLDLQEKFGNTALMYAETKDNIEVAKLLIEKGAKLNLQKNTGETALTLATWNGRNEFAKLLIDKGAKLDLQNQYGDTALMAAVKKGNTEIAKLLIDKGAKLDLQNQYGESVLTIAALGGNVRLVVELLKHGADPLLVDSSGRTPRDYANHAGHTEIVAILDQATRDAIKPEVVGKDVRPYGPKNTEEHVTATGTGFRVSQEGFFITNYHVIDGCRTIKIGGYVVAVVVTDQTNDFAVLKGQAGDVAQLRAGKDIRVGDFVAVIGYPLSGILGSGIQSVSGEISGMSGILNDSRFFQISAPVNPGNSGGPLVDASGHIVGVVTAKLNAIKLANVTGDIPQNINFALKANILRTFLDLNNIKYSSAKSEKLMEIADIVDQARRYTYLVECWN